MASWRITDQHSCFDRGTNRIGGLLGAQGVNGLDAHGEVALQFTLPHLYSMRMLEFIVDQDHVWEMPLFWNVFPLNFQIYRFVKKILV